MKIKNRKSNIIARIWATIIVCVMLGTSIETFTISAITKNEVEVKLNRLIDQYKGTTWNGNFYGIQCKGFANLIFSNLFGVYIGPYDETTKSYIPNPNGAYEVGRLDSGHMSIDGAKKILQKGVPGDYIQVRRRNKTYGHSMILVGNDSNGINVFDCNSDGKNGVKCYYIDWNTFYNKNSAMSLYHAKNYELPPSEQPSFTVNLKDKEYVSGNSYSITGNVQNGGTYPSVHLYIDYEWVADTTNNQYGNYAFYLNSTNYKDGEHLLGVKLTNEDGFDYTSWYKIIIDNTKPTIKSAKIVDWNSDGYVIRINTEDANGIKECKVATWTEERGQDDLKWRMTTYQNSNYDVWIPYKEHGTGKDFNNHIYVYDNAGNCTVNSCKWTKIIKVESISIKEGEKYCSNLLINEIGKSYFMKVETIPNDADNKEVTWTSSDSTVASVDSNGKITAKKDGVAKITATAKDGGGASAFCIIKVKSYGIMYGDCNGDGAVTATDLSFMNQAVNGTLTLTEVQKQVFDLNGDGSVDSKDMELLNQFILKTRTSFPVEEQLSEIVISTLPKKTTYYVGDPISIQGVTVIAYYNNGTTKTVTSINIEGNTETSGRKTVTLSYTESDITKSVSYQINVREKEVIETATPVQTIQPIVTINPTIVPSPIVTSAAVVISTPSSVVIATTQNPTQTALNSPTATPTHVTTYPSVTGEIHSTAVPKTTASPIIKPIETTNPTKDISDNQNNQKEAAEQYEEYEIADKKDALNEGDSFEINSVIYEVIDDSSDEPTVELVAIEKSNIKSVSVPATVKCEGITYKVAGIAKSAFKNNKKITSLTIGSNVTYIGSYAFYKNTKLKKITIKSLKLDKIQKKAFWGLPRRVKVILPTSKKSIYNNMLKNAGLGKR